MSHEMPKQGEPILFFDVESLPVEADDPRWQALAATIVAEDGESDEDLAARVEKLRLMTSLSGLFGRPWMIGFADRNAEPILCSGDGSPDSEIRVLQSFWEGVKDYHNPWWVGHNILHFDIPFIQVRALHHGMPELARKLDRSRKPPWEKRVLDTMKLWPRTGQDRNFWKDGLRGMGGIDTICQFLGIEVDDGTTGADVYDAFLRGDQASVEKHLHADVLRVRGVFRHLWPIL